MHIKQLLATDFMRYHEVRLDNLPQKGLFAIQGANESGKSTLGQLIYFALSGKSLYGSSPEDLINWEKNQLKVEATFEHEGKIVNVYRQVDRDGSNFSKMTIDNELCAQGNDQVAEKINQLIGYHPTELKHSFLITHRVLQSLLQSNPSSHVEFMVGVNKIENLIKTGNKSAEKLIDQIQDCHQHIKELDDKKNNIGYSEEEELALQTQREELEEKQKNLEAALHQKKEELGVTQGQLATVESESKVIPQRIDTESFVQLCSELPAVIRKLNDLPLQGKSQEHLQQSISILDRINRYQQGCELLADKFEQQLHAFRVRLGITNQESETPAKDSFKSREERQTGKCKRASALRKFWLWTTFLLLTCIIFCTAAYIKHDQVLKFSRSIGLEQWLDNKQLAQNWFSFKEMFKPGEKGYPMHETAWAVCGGMLFLQLLLIFITLKSNLTLHRQQNELHLIQEEKKVVQNEYHTLLTVDFKEMNEVADVIDGSRQDELKEAFLQFKEEHPLFVESDYKTEAVVHQARQRLDELIQSIKLRIHQIQLELQQAEEGIAAEKNQLNTVLPKLENIQKKKSQFIEACDKKSELNELSENMKKDLAVYQCMKELADGCKKSMLTRLKVIFTNLYKNILPKITSDRYASVKMDENFKIRVFSDERNDFVPLEQLSSGTNDLFILIFQIILTHGFMESKKVDDHFIFLDEPLLAVDTGRYQHLTDLLPAITPKFNQVFLCRPPERTEHAYLIETQLASTTLIVDFSTIAV